MNANEDNECELIPSKATLKATEERHGSANPRGGEQTSEGGGVSQVIVPRAIPIFSHQPSLLGLAAWPSPEPTTKCGRGQGPTPTGHGLFLLACNVVVIRGSPTRLVSAYIVF
jgi:hypothetical protein